MALPRPHIPAEPEASGSPSVRVVTNPKAADRQALLEGPLSPEGFDAALGEISGWPGYAPTPLVRLPGLAGALGLGAIHYKDEAPRFGLGSFKPLGAPYAILREIARTLSAQGVAEAETVSFSDLASGRFRDTVGAITLVSATDGNHGRAVAWGAHLFGAKAKIFVHERVTEGRRAAIESLGGEVVVCKGGYDESVAEAFAYAARHGVPVIQDTSIGDYRTVPIDITHGYGVLAAEVVAALDIPPTHAVVQAGVGGLASAVCAELWRHYGPDRPRFITLEPTNAACIAESLSAGTGTEITGDTHSAMAGLACGRVSDTAWEVLATGADAAIVLDDASAFEGMRRLASPDPGDPAIVAGECAGGAVGALIALADRPDLRAVLGLDETCRVLLIGTEGATDPAIYADVVGRTPAAVMGSAR